MKRLEEAGISRVKSIGNIIFSFNLEYVYLSMNILYSAVYVVFYWSILMWLVAFTSANGLQEQQKVVHFLHGIYIYLL